MVKKSRKRGSRKKSRKAGKSRSKFDVSKIRRALKREVKKKPEKRERVETGIKGFDALFENGIPKGSSVMIAGGAGSGKTILCLQILANAVKKGEKCLYMSFEESESHLREHMENFGWDPRELEKRGKLVIRRFSTFEIARAIDAMLAKSEGELVIDVKPILIPKGFRPDRIVIDSLTAISSAFVGRESYRSYIEHLFRYLENLGSTSFLITETEEVPKIFSPTGVEEFLADGVVVLYNIRKGDVRENAIEVLKMRGTKHKKKVVAMQILEGKGIEVYPEQEVFGGIGK